MGNKKSKYKVGKVLIFNVYGNEPMRALFERVDYCEQQLKGTIEDQDYAAFEQEFVNLRNEFNDVKHTMKKFSNKDVIISFETQLQKIQEQINALKEKVIAMQGTTGKTSTASDTNAHYEEKFDKFLREFLDHIQEQDKKISDLEHVVSVQNDTIRKLEDRIQKLESAASAAPKPVVKTESPRSTSTASTISSEKPISEKTVSVTNVEKKAESVSKRAGFSLPLLTANQDKFYITGQSTNEQIHAYLKTVLDISSITKTLQASSIDEQNKDIYQKILTNYANGLLSTLKKKRISELDEEEISETVITTIGEAIQNAITGKIVPAVADRIRRGFSGFSGFLFAINQYLESIGFYTEAIKVGEKATDRENSVHMEIIYTTTTDRQLHGKIYEITTLPYLINFINEDEEKDKFVCKGSCFAYRYE